MTPSIRCNRGKERGSSWREGWIPLWPTQRPKTKHWWLLIWTSSAAKIKSQGPWLQCWGERRRFNKTSKAKWNPGRILLFICWTKSCTTVFLYICREKFDECQLPLALGPHPSFIQSSFLPPVPVFSWMKLTLVEGAIRMEQCYGAPYSHFIGPQWYFIDAWNNASVQLKQAIWKTLEKLKVFENAWEDGCNGYCRRAFPTGLNGI